MALYEALGYETMKAGGSLGKWDFHAWTGTDAVYVQVKTGRWAGTEEMEAIREAVVPRGARKLVHRWMPHKRLPDIKEVD